MMAQKRYPVPGFSLAAGSGRMKGTPMNFNYDHDRFVHKNRSIAQGYSVDNRDKTLEDKGFSRFEHKSDASCFNCKTKSKCPEFRAKRSGGSTGAVSFGGDEKFLCDRYLPSLADSKSMSGKQIKALMKNFKRVN
jgi:hypothetical protein